VVSVTPEEAARFYEDDEDPAGVFARFGAGPHVVTARPGGGMAGYARGGVIASPSSGSDQVPFPAGSCLYGHVVWARHYIASRYGEAGDAQ